jgi:hypothetical protein
MAPALREISHIPPEALVQWGDFTSSIERVEGARGPRCVYILVLLPHDFRWFTKYVLFFQNFVVG